MPFYMQHPDHGVHICYTPEDVKAHEAIGWKPMEEATQSVRWSALNDVIEYTTEKPKKRGRKPKAKA